MDHSSRATHALRQTSALIAAGGVLVAVCLVMSLKGYQQFLLAGLGFAVAVMIARFLPLTTVTTLIITGLLPTVLQMTPSFTWSYKTVGWGFDAEDLVLLSMLGATLLEVLRTKKMPNHFGLSKYIMLFGLWLLFEILRNVEIYGLSAPGEFRFRYLILALPLYVGIFFSAQRSRTRLLKLLIMSSLVIPLLCVPLIGLMKGWSIGAESRFFPAHISLGLVLATVALLLAHKHKLLRLKTTLVVAATVSALVMILIDGHRSVWLTLFTCLAVLVATREIDLSHLFRYTVPVLILAGITILVSSDIGSRLVSFISERGTALVNYEEDPTAGWRAAIWSAALDQITASPLAGEGFGGYWRFELPGTGEVVTVSPHNLYIQSLVKIGVVGFFLYFLIVYKLGRAFNRFLRDTEARSKRDYALVATGFVVLISSHVFYFAYAFEYSPWLFIGIGAAALGDRSGSRGA